MWLRDWADLRRVRQVAAELLPEDLYTTPVLSPDGLRLVVPSCERVHVIDLDRGEIVGELGGFGDWSVEPRFAPDGMTLAVGNSMQGSWWLTVLEPGDGNLRHRYERQDGPPTGHGPEIVTDVAFTPDGRRFAIWVRPDHGRSGSNGYRGLVTTTWAQSGESAWHLHVDDDITGARGQVVSASLCFTPGGSWLAVGLDSGVLWLDAETGTPARHDRTTGSVNALASHPTSAYSPPPSTDYASSIRLPVEPHRQCPSARPTRVVVHVTDVPGHTAARADRPTGPSRLDPVRIS